MTHKSKRQRRVDAIQRQHDAIVRQYSEDGAWFRWAYAPVVDFVPANDIGSKWCSGEHTTKEGCPE